jgi:type II secretory ATPase GspE/PulE/Tfp pilus assembly ATPase PilB-like protein
MLLAELVIMDDLLREAVLIRADTHALERCVAESGQPTIWTTAEQALKDGLTTREEITRVLGPLPS